MGITDVESLALNTPSLHYGQVGQTAVVTMRGIGLENLRSTGEAGVGFQIDGVHLGRPSAASAVFWDLERVSVLRGPQGTQGGRNTNGGRIELWSRRPNEHFDAFGDIQYGDYDQVRSRSVANLPLLAGTDHVEKLMTRWSFVWGKRDGYQKNEFTGVMGSNADDQDGFAGRGQIRSLWFDESLELRLIGTHAYQRGRGPALHLLGDPPSNANANVGLLKARGQLENFLVDCPKGSQPGFLDEVCFTDDPRKTYADFVPDRDNHQEGITGLVTWNLPFLDDTILSDLRFKFIGSWQQNVADSKTDFDGTNIPNSLLELRREARQHSFETYLERPDVGDGLWDFRGGFYYYMEHVTEHFCFDANGAFTNPDASRDDKNDKESYAGFLDLGLRPFENLRVNGAVRYTYETKRNKRLTERFTILVENDRQMIAEGTKSLSDFVDARNGETKGAREGCGRYFLDQFGFPNEPGNFGWLLIGNTSRSGPRKKGFSRWTPRFAFDWEVTEDSTLGFSATRGSKVRGISSDIPSETVWNYELTSKNLFFDDLLRFNTTLFWTEFDPFQICQFRGPFFTCRADGAATIRGIEIEFTATPIDGLQLNGHFHYLVSRVNDFQIRDPTNRSCVRVGGECPGIPPTPTDVSGNSLPKAPDWAGSFGIQYALDLGESGFLTPRIQTQFQGRTYFRVFNKSEFSQEPFAKLDLSLTWQSEDARFKAEFLVSNLTDEDVINSIFIGPQGSGGQVLAQYQPPRLISARITVNSIADWVNDLF
jgi:iron complex outermembrane receptor protein